MENKLVSGGVPPFPPLSTFTSLTKKEKGKEKKTQQRWSGDVGEGLGKQEIMDIGEVYSFDSFFCGNVFRIKLDMTFSRLPMEKYFLIPEGALGKWNSLATRLACPGYGGKIRSHAVQCNNRLHSICSVVDEGTLGPPSC